MWRFIPGRFAVAGLLHWSFGALAAHYTVPLPMPAGASGEPRGVVRILNATDEVGTVEIYAVDDADTRSGPATFTLNASAAVEFGASDLVSGIAMKGLTGGIGTVSGDARIEIDTELRIVSGSLCSRRRRHTQRDARHRAGQRRFGRRLAYWI